jgi:hypothetical protein
MLTSIIFVHGLRGHPRTTWEDTPPPPPPPDRDRHGSAHKAVKKLSYLFRSEAKQQQTPSTTYPNVFWPEQFLAEDIPNARILTYGYNADVIGGLFQANNKNSISQHGRDLKAKLERDVENEVLYAGLV